MTAMKSLFAMGRQWLLGKSMVAMERESHLLLWKTMICYGQALLAMEFFLVAMEVTGCYGKLIVAILITGFYGMLVNDCFVSHWLPWEVTGCYGSQWLLWKHWLLWKVNGNY
jgi:hypothetical protein